MERRANYALVGVGTLGLFVALMAFIVWLTGYSFTKHFDVYDVVFIGPVRGISEGGEVNFNGIKVGEVTELSLDPADPNKVVARIRITGGKHSKSGVPVRVDSYAILEPQGITGVNYIQLTGGTPTKPLLKDVTPAGKVPVIHSQKSTLADLLEGGGTVMQRAVDALERVNKLLSDQNIGRASALLDDLKSVADEARERKAILADAQQAMQDVDKTANAITELSQSSNRLVNGDAKQTLANLSDAAAEMKTTARDARSMIGRLEGPTSDFATNGLPQLTSTIVSLQETSRSLNGLVSEIQKSPTGALGKSPAKEVKVKP